MILNRLKKNFKKLYPQMKANQINAFRLYDKDIPEFPYIVECFDQSDKATKAVIWFKGDAEIDSEEKKSSHKDDIIQAVCDVLEISLDDVIFKTRQKQSGPAQYGKLAKSNLSLTVNEGPLKFKVNLTDYLDTGLFLDHRPLRKWILKKDLADKNFLNLFSYTCSISVAAAMAKAKCTSVDLSSHYLNWGQDNFKLNDINPTRHEFIRSDVFDFLNQAKAQRLSYDLIVLDPPTFSNSKSTEDDFDVQHDHKKYILTALDLLKANGLLYFSTNKKKFKLDQELFELENFELKDLTSASIPQDFHSAKAHSLYSFQKC